jgi:hypothetical protein
VYSLHIYYRKSVINVHEQRGILPLDPLKTAGRF